MRFNFCTVAVIATTATTISTVVNANRNIFGISSRSKSSIFGGQHHQLSNSNIITSLPRGGATAELIGEVVDEPEPLYLPGLLEASIPSKSSSTSNTPTTALADYTISISSSKAKELNIKNGEIVAIIGRRRRVSYGTALISKMKNGSVKLSNNLATNLRVMDTDKVKIVPLNTSDNGEENESESYTLGNPPSDIAHSVTFAPIRDSLHTLELKERGGDEFSDEEISERFVVPYLNMDEDGDGNSVVVLREGHTLVLKDDNGVSLEFMVSHLDLVGDDSENEESVVADSGKFLFLMFVCI